MTAFQQLLLKKPRPLYGDLPYRSDDGLGSVRQVVNASGTTVATNTTDEYGVPDPAAVSGSAELLAHTYVGGLGVRNETGFPSGVAARGLYYMRQRWYDATLGAFISADPLDSRAATSTFTATRARPR